MLQQNAIVCTETVLLSCLIKTFVLKLDFVKRCIFNIITYIIYFSYLHTWFHGYFWELHSYQQASSLMDHQTHNKTSMSQTMSAFVF